MASREQDEVSEQRHYEQFDPDLKTGEPDVFTPDVVADMNRKLEQDFLDLVNNGSTGSEASHEL